MALSSSWKRKMLAYAFIAVLDIVVLVLSVLVNIFQDFFFVADLFPLILSIVTLVVLLLQTVIDLTRENAFTSRPAFEIPLLGILTVVWLAFNSFTESRYTDIPNCSVFSDELDGEVTWCRNVQGLRVIIWIEWLALLVTTLMLTRAAIVRARRGNTAVWHTALSRYNRTDDDQSRDFFQEASSFYRGSSIFGFDRVNTQEKSSSRDWFAPTEPVIRSNDTLDGEGGSSSCSFFGTGTAGLSTFGNGSQSSFPLQQQFQFLTPQTSKDTAVTKTIDGFEIVSTGYRFQNEGIWNKSESHKNPG